MFKVPKFLLFVILLSVIVGCDGFKLPKNIFETSARAKYERAYDGPDSLITMWKNQYEVAAASKLIIADGFSAIAEFQADDVHALSYQLELKHGDLLVVEAKRPDSLQHRIFVDVYPADLPVNSSSSTLLEAGTYTHFTEKNGFYRVVIQPEIAFSDTFNLKIYTQPSMLFPVAGKGNSAVQSFWGAIRDGGARNHEGVDIFASRGTPVVAVADGIVMRTGNQGLGGKQVWQRDGLLGNSLYYAHLDSVMTTAGTRVKVGDTLGTVGSTGNAAGGSPHLHFGIYSTGGAVDPWPFLRKRDAPKNSQLQIPRFETVKAGTNIRRGPGTAFEIADTTPVKKPVKILATTAGWFHIKTSTGKEGFVQKNRLE